MHEFAVHVYYEDTDLAGIVYYANYLKFIERARTEWVRDCGVDQRRLKEQEGIVFAVRRLEADYHAPAKFDDDLTVRTDVVAMTGVRLVLSQDVFRGADLLFSSEVTLVALNSEGAPTRLPAIIRRQMH